MSEPREVEHTVVTNPSALKTEDFASLSRTEKKARLAVVLDRGLTADRLVVPLPPELYGEWVVNDASEISRMQTMGFDIDTEYAPNRALHGSGTKEGRVADIIFMTTNRETKELIDELRQEAFLKTHGKGATRTNQKEEAEFRRGINEPGVTAITESVDSSANAEQLKQALFQT